ncbi:MAG: OmpA family protein [Spirosomataceae bacterium]
MKSRFTLLVLLCTSLFVHAQDFAVLVSAYNEKVPAWYFEKLGNVKESYEPPFYKYYLMGYKTEAEATEAAKSAVAKGFVYARVENITALRALASGCCGVLPLQESLTLRHVFFDFDKADLTSKSISDLDKLFRYLQQHPDYQVELRAHTDAIGSNEYNQNLSERRKESVKSYLLRRGIETNRIRGEIFGEEKPIAKNEINGNDAPKGRSLNRRVEIVVWNGNEIVPVVEDIVVPDPLK